MSDANNADDLKEELARQLHMVAMLKERIEEHKLALRESHEREDALRKQLGDTYVALIKKPLPCHFVIVEQGAPALLGLERKQ